MIEGRDQPAKHGPNPEQMMHEHHQSDLDTI